MGGHISVSSLELYPDIHQGALIECGFELIEVPLNSPEPFASIERLSRRFGGDCYIGAGTVLKTVEDGYARDFAGTGFKPGDKVLDVVGNEWDSLPSRRSPAARSPA